MSANTTANLCLHGFADEIVLQQGATFFTFGGLRVDAGQLVQLAAEDAADTVLKVEASLRNGDWIATSVTSLRRASPTPSQAPASAPAAARPAAPAHPPASAAGVNNAPQRGATPSGFGRPSLVSGTPPAASPAPAQTRTPPAPPPQRPASSNPFAGLMGSRPAASAGAPPGTSKPAASTRPAFDPKAADEMDDIPF